jgi:hypothetical protein
MDDVDLLWLQIQRARQIFAQENGYCVCDQTPSRLSRHSASAQEGPMDVWARYGRE